MHVAEDTTDRAPAGTSRRRRGVRTFPWNNALSYTNRFGYTSRLQNRVPSPPRVTGFTPVPRKYRHDGWTAERQRAFIAALAETGSVTAAARRVNMAKEGAYQMRLHPEAESFRAAWEAALDHGVQTLVDIAIDRAREGVPVPVFHKGSRSARSAGTTIAC